MARLLKGIEVHKKTKKVYKTSNGEKHGNALTALRTQRRLNAKENVRAFLIKNEVTFASAKGMISTAQFCERVLEPGFIAGLKKAASLRKRRKVSTATA